MASYPPPYPPPPGYDRRAQKRFLRDQARAQRAAFRAHREQMRMQARSLRRGSILGPVVLIAAGIVFLLLQSGRLDYARVGEWYGRWWPFLLVAAGLVVLAEWAVDQYLMRNPEQPPYRRSVGGGVFLLLLFALVGAGVIGNGVRSFPNEFYKLFPGSNLDHLSFDELIGDKHESDQTFDYAMTAGSSLFVVNPNGNVSVSGISNDGRIHVALHKQIYATSDSDAESKAGSFVPTTSNVGQTFDLTMPSLEGARGDLVVTVPATAATTVTADRGDVAIESIKTAVSVNANQGSVDLSAIAGPSFVRMNNTRAAFAAHNMGGPVTVQGRANDLTLADVAGQVNLDGQFFGPTHLEHILNSAHFHTSRTDLQLARLDGQVDINNSGISADQALGPVVLRTSYRNISLDRISGDVAVTNRNGTVDLLAAPALGNISIENRNGAVNVTVPPKAAFAVDARTSNGDINTDFNLSASGSEQSRFLTGTVGAGGPLLRIVTSDGDVSIHKADLKPLPTATSTLPKNGTYEIVNVNSGMALESPAMSHTASQHMDQGTVNGGRNQLWTLSNLGGNIVTLTNGYSSQLLDVGGASDRPGALVNQFPYNGDANQKWQIISLGNGQFELASVNSGLALDVKEASMNTGAAIQQYTYHGAANQKWTFIAKSPTGDTTSPPANAPAGSKPQPPPHLLKHQRASAQ
jgi:hypothetical protein